MNEYHWAQPLSRYIRLIKNVWKNALDSDLLNSSVRKGTTSAATCLITWTSRTSRVKLLQERWWIAVIMSITFSIANDFNVTGDPERRILRAVSLTAPLPGEKPPKFFSITGGARLKMFRPETSQLTSTKLFKIVQSILLVKTHFSSSSLWHWVH